MRLTAALLLLVLPTAAAAQPTSPPAHPEHPAGSNSTEHKSTEHKATEHKSAEHDSTEHRGGTHRRAEHKAATHKPAEHKPAEHKPRAATPSTPAKPAPGAAATHPAIPAGPPAPAAIPAVPPPAVPLPDPHKGSNTGLPLPRFASLRSDDVNFRSGPGTRYPIEWVYKRRDLPVQIDREFEVWRLVEDSAGTKGWVHQATLMGRRTAVVAGVQRVLRASGDDAAAPVAKLQPGVIIRIRACAAGSQWCEAQVGDYHGWIKRTDIWGVTPDEVIQ